MGRGGGLRWFYGGGGRFRFASRASRSAADGSKSGGGVTRGDGAVGSGTIVTFGRVSRMSPLQQSLQTVVGRSSSSGSHPSKLV